MIGRVVRKELEESGHEVVGLTREMLYDEKGVLLRSALRGCAAVVHLAGAPVLQRWTASARKEIMESRTVTTRHLVEAVNALLPGEKPALFLSASAIGIYRNGEVHDEQSLQYDTHFAAEVTQAWEKASEGLDIHVRRVVFRIGLVLDAHSKLISLLWLPFRMGAGGPIGSGKQPFPFIHLNDLVRAMFWVLENRQAHGIYNLVALERITNRDFARQFGALLHRPALLPVPAFFMRLLYGTAAVMVLESPAVHPARLMSEGFSFRYPSLQWALEEIVARKKEKRPTSPGDTASSI